MIVPLALAITLSLDKNMMSIPSLSEKHWQPKEISLSYDSYQYTTKDINKKPYEYIKEKTSDILYKTISEELLQEEEEK
jgi:hypothetical protein